MLTDGEPTDTNPSLTLSNAKQLPLDRFTIRINTRGESINERYTTHKSIIEGCHTAGDNTWTSNYQSIEAYMNDLLSLAENFGSSPNINISSAKDLETAIFDKVIQTTVGSCQN